ncbi:MAG: ATP-dependent endonuclease, partial [Candidatus Electrothrix sp. AW3_4]|nr:ATP-dependent endonuclease [Candidatus Electrothrix gigas]
ICGRSFEDAFMLANRELFELNHLKGVQLEKAVLTEAKKIQNSSKANFAIRYSVDKTDWVIPNYICEGLGWLDTDPEYVAGEVEI